MAICISGTRIDLLNFGLARDYGGKCNLRSMIPTRPKKNRNMSIRSLPMCAGSALIGRSAVLRFGLFRSVVRVGDSLDQDGKAYVDDLTADQMREHRGTLTDGGKESPYRNRSIEENLDLFERMKKGEFPDGTRVLRAKIDMASPNLNMRDPVMYRIRHVEHQRTGNKWCIYPMYDWAHGECDSIEGITTRFVR